MKKTAFLLLLILTACTTPKQTVQGPVNYHQTAIDHQPQTVVIQQTPTDNSLLLPLSARPTMNVAPLGEEGTWLGNLQRRLSVVCQDDILETTQLGLCIYDLTDDRLLFASNANQRMRPASCQKLITSISALHYLGGNYRFETELRYSGKIVNGVLNGDLYVVGSMDPTFSNADWQLMLQMLKDKGIQSVSGSTFQDLSRRSNDAYGWGWCWDDDYGPLSAFTIDGKPSDLPIQTAPAKTELVGKISHDVNQILIPMMKKSDNIYAESLFYNLAFHSGKAGAGRKQATELINKLIDSEGLSSADFQIADGSGLSLYNYVSPQLLVWMLRHAWQNEQIRTSLLPAMPVAGVDGTLEKRMKNTKAENNVRAKTGTVNGISSLSGYATASNGHTIAFSIINQGVPSSKVGKDFQDKICICLCE